MYGQQVRPRAQPGHRGGDDDAAAAGLLHDRDDLLGGDEQRLDVDVHDPVPLGVGRLLERLGEERQAGVGEVDVELAEAVDGGVDGGVARGAVGDVAVHRQQVILTVRLLQARESLLVDVERDDVAALGEEALDRRAAHPRATAGDHAGLAGQAGPHLGHLKLSRCAHAGSTFTQMFLIWEYARKPAMPFSRPFPLFLNPPNGSSMPVPAP